MMNKRELYDTSKNVKIGILVVILQKELHCYKHTLSASYLRWACGTHGRGEKIVQGFGGKAQRKETTRKTKA
jgi:hypothetical protein